MIHKYAHLIINQNSSILSALKQMDSINKKLLIVMHDNRFVSLISIGDIQRAIINGIDLNVEIKNILRKNVIYAMENDDLKDLKTQMKDHRTEFMPIIDCYNNLVRVIFWEELFNEKICVGSVNLPVVIMAGGRGTRLKPLTNIIPKPLIPVNKKTIIEDIMDRFVEHECNRFYLSVNYKADMIRYYFEVLRNPTYMIEYFQEDKPLGTAGSLALLKGKVDETFFVSNCDILVEQDYSEILKYHRESNSEITVVAALKNYSIPYGSIITGENGKFIELNEKPIITFKINSGMYIIEPHILYEIPNNEFLHITHLIEIINSRGGRVGVFPISEESWKDFGSLKSYEFKTE